MAEQTYASHRRYAPLYHFVALPILSLNLGFALLRAGRAPTRDTIWEVVMAIGLIALLTSARTMALTVQNRVIRLEERLRLQRVLPANQHDAIDRLRLRQLVALRFAPDDELPELVRRCAAGELAETDQIKRQIKAWRPDYVRA
jgi:hypothetical protein